LILVDTSVWIDFFSSSSSPASRELQRLILEAKPIALAGVIVLEILQGLKRDAHHIERYLLQWEMLEPSGFSTYREASAMFRLARSKGISLSSIDTLIAAIAMEQGASVFSLDQDFSRIARMSSLELYSLPGLAS
jgi:predicted nucleic acid-binding protein